ncbi:MAG: hypothetical protein AAGI01_00805, partial [Myxococcota bacterium]
MATLIGIDIGTHAIKAVVLDPKLKHKIVHVDEELVNPPAPTPALVPEPEVLDAPVPADAPAEPAFVESSFEGFEDVEELDESDLLDDVHQTDPEAVEAMGADATVGQEVFEEELSDEVAPEEVVGALEEEPSERPSWARALERLVARLDVQNATMVMALPHGKAMTIHVEELPFSSKAQVSQILPGILSERLPMELSEVVLDIQMVKRGEENSAIIGFARAEDIGAFLQEAQVAGADPAV